MDRKINNSVLELIQGDITELSTDAIVNAANTQLVLGGGVAGAIRMKGGPGIQAECSKKGPISTGEAVITTGGQLKAEYVIHAVGPRQGQRQEDEKLKSATLNALKVADVNGLKSIAFPAISTGIFGFSMDRCAEIMLSATIDYLQGPTSLERVIFCLYDQTARDVFRNCLSQILRFQ